jgi:hypothetical protein
MILIRSKTIRAFLKERINAFIPNNELLSKKTRKSLCVFARDILVAAIRIRFLPSIEIR